MAFFHLNYAIEAKHSKAKQTKINVISQWYHGDSWRFLPLVLDYDGFMASEMNKFMLLKVTVLICLLKRLGSSRWIRCYKRPIKSLEIYLLWDWLNSKNRSPYKFICTNCSTACEIFPLEFCVWIFLFRGHCIHSGSNHLQESQIFQNLLFSLRIQIFHSNGFSFQTYSTTVIFSQKFWNEIDNDDCKRWKMNEKKNDQETFVQKFRKNYDRYKPKIAIIFDEIIKHQSNNCRWLAIKGKKRRFVKQVHFQS